MTWTPLPFLALDIECQAPYSFYFSLIEPFWKADACDSSPLHRLATLARKQGAKALVIEDASDISGVKQEITTLDERLGGGGSAEALLLSFLSELPTNEDIGTVSDQALIGQCTLVNYRPKDAAEFQSSFVFEAIFATPSLETGEPLLNNFINCEASFEVAVRGRQFNIRGLYYAQQNGITSVCAHACIRMVVRTLYPNQPSPSTEAINALIGHSPPAEGMLPDQIVSVLKALTHRDVTLIPCGTGTAAPAEGNVELIESKSLTAAEYVSVLTAAADSGDIALLCFETGAERDKGAAPVTGPRNPANHVVVVYGYTRNSDEWHPQAMPEYSGAPSAPHSPSSAWVDHFVIHDDNFGPYLALSNRALEAHTSVRADWILIVRRLSTNLEPHAAEAATAIIMGQAAQMFAGDAPDNKWLNYLLRYRRPLVTRPVLLTRQEYWAHIATTVAHDNSHLGPGASQALLDDLPEILWMVEFTVPDLFTGNHSKLGEILLEANHESGTTFSKDRVRGIRVPSRFMIARGGEARDIAGYDTRDGVQPQDVRSFPLTSHSPRYECNPPSRQW